MMTLAEVLEVTMILSVMTSRLALLNPVQQRLVGRLNSASSKVLQLSSSKQERQEG